MTKRDFLKLELLKGLNFHFKDFGYRLNRSLAEFTKRNKDGWFKYQVIFLKIEGGWELKPSLLLRIDIVEDIFHKISEFEEKYKKNTPTIGISIEDYQKNGTYSYPLTEEQQINYLSQKLFLVFQEVGLPFFEKYNSIKEIDKALNNKPEDISLTGPIFKGFKALIIAKLVKRTNYKELEKVYLNYYKNFSDGFYFNDYLNLVKFLEKWE